MMQLGLGLVWLTTLLCISVQQNHDSYSNIERSNPIFLAPRKAKTLLRVKRWGIKRLTGEEREEESESRERRREAQRRAQLAATCRSSCWGQWGPWSACSRPCGSSAIETSTRPISPAPQCTAWVAANGCQHPTNHPVTRRVRPRIGWRRGRPTSRRRILPVWGSFSRPPWTYGSVPGTRHKPCNRKCQNGGTLRPNDCACPPGFKDQCCQTRVTCGYPGKPTNGNVSPVGSSHLFNTVARFTCNTGYRMNGPATRKCLSNGKWSGRVPTCGIISCGNPGTPANSQRQGSDYRYQRSVVYNCNTGYALSGSKTRQCQSNGKWSAAAPACNIITCGAPAKPAHGSVRVTSGQYNQHGSVAEFGCTAGYHLRGSSRRTCHLNRQWSGTQPTCQRIKCKALSSPAHGSVTQPMTSGRVDFGASARFTCANGYRLRGPSSRTCGGARAEGRWSGTQPQCHVVSCGNPPTPAHGGRVGSVFTFNKKVAYTCQPGYKLNGVSTITCQANGQWSSSAATCLACPKNTYKTGFNSVTQCTACPTHSHTVTTASTDVQHCTCDIGYRGQPGGPCQRVTCPAMTAPAHGRISSCPLTYNSLCKVTCLDGHIETAGESERQCRQNGQWSEEPLVCSACPRDTYKSAKSTCSRCPSLTRTTGVGNMKSGCVCLPGYTGPPSGPCTDVNECSTNNGACQQSCRNTVGSFQCSCNQAGYVQDINDNKRCLPKNRCPAMPPPDNGGLVCLGDAATNVERCEVKCNPGFEHIVRTNAYETCGPTTNWRWSFEVNGTPVLPCIEQWFEGVRVEADVAYFIERCDQVSNQTKEQLKTSFIAMLRSQGVCLANGIAVCDFADFRISCGDVTDNMRKKRTTTGFKELRLKFNIKVRKRQRSSVNCTPYCQGGATGQACTNICIERYRNSARQNLQGATTKMRELFADQVSFVDRNPAMRGQSRPSGRRSGSGGFSSLRRMSINLGTGGVQRSLPASTLRIGGMVLLPRRLISASTPRSGCEAGTVAKEGMCVPCPSGSYLVSSNATCQLCPRGTYQPSGQQTSCITCATLQNSSQTGAITCPR